MVAVIRLIELARNWFGCIYVVFFLRHAGVRETGPPIFFLFRLCRFLHSVQIMQQMTFTEKHVKWSVTLEDRLGPEIVTVFEIKGQLLHRVRLHACDGSWFGCQAPMRS